MPWPANASAGSRSPPEPGGNATTESPQKLLRSAAAKYGYAVVGHIPVAFGKMPSESMAVLLKGDSALRRIYVVVEPGPRHPAGTSQRQAALRLAEYLLGARGQADLTAADREAGGPWVFPLPKRSLR